MEEYNFEEIDQRIALLQAELQGLMFARNSLTGKTNGKGSHERPNRGAQAKEPKKKASGTAKPATAGSTSHPGDTPSVRMLVLKVLEEYPEELSYRDITDLVSKKAARPVNRKTVSSSLDVLKKQGKVTCANGRYRLAGRTDFRSKEYAAKAA